MNTTRSFIGSVSKVFMAIGMASALCWSGESEAGAAKKLLSSLEPVIQASSGVYSELAGKSLSLGEPAYLWRVSKSTALQYKSSRLLPDLFAQPTAALVPVLANGQILAYVRVKQAGASWVAVELGYETLAREVSLIYKAWPSAKNKGMMLVENEALREFFFTLPTQAAPNLTRIRFVDADDADVSTVKNVKYGELESPDAVIEHIIQVAWEGNNALR